jgi:dolichol-phosphate mannosyltransferase
MSERWLVALPVYNEVHHVDRVLDEVLRYCRDVLVVDDGSTDGTSEVLARRKDVRVLRHAQNKGYGGGLISAFEYAHKQQFDKLVTIDCDGQHEPKRIPLFFESLTPDVDIVSGSRYLRQFRDDNAAPEQRRRINEIITAEVNRRLGLDLTDAFCGFKSYRVSAVHKLAITETGYSMPLELWVQAAYAGLRIKEMPVPRIYLDEKRSFGGALDDGDVRLHYYYLTLNRAIAAAEAQGLARDPMITGNCWL